MNKYYNNQCHSGPHSTIIFNEPFTEEHNLNIFFNNAEGKSVTHAWMGQGVKDLYLKKFQNV